MKTIIIDGVEYDLVPKKEVKNDNTTAYYSCMTDCGTFNFQILLNKDGSIWRDTESITYKEGKEDEDYWDNNRVIKGWLKGYSEDTKVLEENINNEEIKVLNNLRQRILKLGWIKL